MVCAQGGGAQSTVFEFRTTGTLQRDKQDMLAVAILGRDQPACSGCSKATVLALISTSAQYDALFRAPGGRRLKWPSLTKRFEQRRSRGARTKHALHDVVSKGQERVMAERTLTKCCTDTTCQRWHRPRSKHRRPDQRTAK